MVATQSRRQVGSTIESRSSAPIAPRNTYQNMGPRMIAQGKSAATDQVMLTPSRAGHQSVTGGTRDVPLGGALAGGAVFATGLGGTGLVFRLLAPIPRPL